MKTKRQAIDELNEEERYPSYWKGHDFKLLCAFLGVIGIGFIGIICIGAQFFEWLDSKSWVYSLVLVICGLSVFSYWALVGRHKIKS